MWDLTPTFIVLRRAWKEILEYVKQYSKWRVMVKCCCHCGNKFPMSLYHDKIEHLESTYVGSILKFHSILHLLCSSLGGSRLITLQAHKSRPIHDHPVSLWLFGSFDWRWIDHYEYEDKLWVSGRIQSIN